MAMSTTVTDMPVPVEIIRQCQETDRVVLEYGRGGDNVADRAVKNRQARGTCSCLADEEGSGRRASWLSAPCRGIVHPSSNLVPFLHQRPPLMIDEMAPSRSTVSARIAR